MASPAAMSSPAVIAASLPKLRERFTTFAKSQSVDSRSKVSKLPSVEPSLIKTISLRASRLSNTRWIVEKKSRIASASLKIGTTIDISGAGGRGRLLDNSVEFAVNWFDPRAWKPLALENVPVGLGG